MENVQIIQITGDFMKAILPELDSKSVQPYYLQLYEYIKKGIVSGEIESGEKLPSLRSLSKDLQISVTTISQCYAQLEVEGYISAKAGSGYYVNDVGRLAEGPESDFDHFYDLDEEEDHKVYDLSSFDFNKWKKCASRIYTEYSHLLLYEGDPQGEYQLRYEISKYVYNSRGVIARPEQVVIGAGTQQITMQLTRILREMNINHIALEDPGYLPVRKIFEDRSFAITSIPVLSDGIEIEKLPRNISCAVYANPSNQFPTGAIMPVGRRRELLDWAESNSSYIIEDDYNSELRYFGRPIPAMQGMDSFQRVIYLGSFSSTLYPAIKISYMILPDIMADVFNRTKRNYTQTCSKAEQLTLSLFMKQGLYQTNIRKLRKLYTQKLQKITSALKGSQKIKPGSTSSGISMTLISEEPEETLRRAKMLGLSMQKVPGYDDLIFYYNQIPIEDIEDIIKELIA